MFLRLPDIYSHRLTERQRIMLRVAAVGCWIIAVLALIVLILLATNDGTVRPLPLLVFVLAAIPIAGGLWRGAPSAISALVFVLGVATMLSIAIGGEAFRASDWRTVIVCAGVVAVCAPYLTEFWMLCARK